MCEISQMLIEYSYSKSWLEGIEFFLNSKVTKQIFVHLRPEDKELFLAESLVELILAQEEENQQGIDLYGGSLEQ